MTAHSSDTGYTTYHPDKPLPGSAHSLAVGVGFNTPLSAHLAADVFASLGGSFNPVERTWWDKHYPRWSDIITHLVHVIHAREWQEPFRTMTFSNFLCCLDEAYEWYKEQHWQLPESLGKCVIVPSSSKTHMLVPRSGLYSLYVFPFGKCTGMGAQR
jgi:hypothetical protein